MELRGAVLISAGLRFAENSEIKIEHYGLSTSKGSAMVLRVMLHFRLPPAHLAKMGGWQHQDSDGTHVVAGPPGS